MNTKHPCETVEASADVMKLAEMILSDCGCSTSISDRLQRRVAGRIQQHMDSALVGQQQAEPVAYLKTAAGVMQLPFEGNPVVSVGADIEVQADTVEPLFAHLPAQRQAVATQLVCDALVAIVSHSGDPAGTVAALAEWRKKAEVFTSKPATQPPAMAIGCIPVPAEWIEGLLLGDRQHHIELRAMLAAAPQEAVPDGAAKDAARYRWLRDVSVPPHNFYISVPIEFHGVRYSPAEVDAAIDAAIAAQKGGDA